jgi:hypothetical protein
LLKSRVNGAGVIPVKWTMQVRVKGDDNAKCITCHTMTTSSLTTPYFPASHTRTPTDTHHNTDQLSSESMSLCLEAQRGNKTWQQKTEFRDTDAKPFLNILPPLLPLIFLYQRKNFLCKVNPLRHNSVLCFAININIYVIQMRT